MSLDSWMWCTYDGFEEEFGMFMPFHAVGVKDAISYLPLCTSAVAIWVCSFIKAAANSASSALFMVLLMLVTLGFTVVILLD